MANKNQLSSLLLDCRVRTQSPPGRKRRDSTRAFPAGCFKKGMFRPRCSTENAVHAIVDVLKEIATALDVVERRAKRAGK